MSFQKAAEELHVSPSAVSQQIKKLEGQLRVKFFRRVSNRLLLTEAGENCADLLHQGMRLLAQAAGRVEAMREGTVVRLSTAPSFASKWLIPRLSRFRDRYPDIDLRIDVSMALTDFKRGNVDLALRYGQGRYFGLYTELLACETVFPVCSPHILPPGRPVRPEDLSGFVLLHDDSTELDPSCPDWRDWFDSMGLHELDCDRGVHINQSDLVIDAAAAGRGVALAKELLVAEDLRSGRLVRLFDARTPVASGYYLVCPRANVTTPGVAAFLEWIRSEFEPPAIAPAALAATVDEAVKYS